MRKFGAKNKEPLTWPTGCKRCTSCNIIKTYSNFHRHKECIGGYNTVCKECRKPKSKLNYSAQSLEYTIWSRAKSRSKRLKYDFNLEVGDIIIPEVCPVFKTKFVKNDIDYTASIDRIDPSKGYIKGNICIISNKANRMKSNATAEEVFLLSKYLSGSCEI